MVSEDSHGEVEGRNEVRDREARRQSQEECQRQEGGESIERQKEKTRISLAMHSVV